MDNMDESVVNFTTYIVSTNIFGQPAYDSRKFVLSFIFRNLY